MRKFLFLVLCIYMTISASASLANTYVFEYEDCGITVVFNENTKFNADERQYIADYIAYTDSDMDNVSTYSWCWLTGHDIKHDTITTIDHKASPTEPRCYEVIYLIDICNNCTYMEKTTLSSMYIPCCPED